MKTLALAALIVLSNLTHAQVTVPVVGCPSDGQLGPQPGPQVPARATVHVPSGYAPRLALYRFEEDPGILAPRGWHCLELIGSDGIFLLIAPDTLVAKDFFTGKPKVLDGPGLQFSVSLAGTSGRFEVAKTIARVFPTHRNFVRRIIAEQFEPAKNFPYGPYPHDILKYHGTNEVLFTTPANSLGLGTDSYLAKSSLPISGVAFLSPPDLDLTFLAVRLSNMDSDLTPLIIDAVGARHH